MHSYQNPYRSDLPFRERMASFWVTMAGCGASRVAPGTVGALLGAIVFLAVADLPWWIPLLLIIIGFGISVWAIDFAEN
ncbi:MAG: phosphatidylglycerophosphatase A [Bdellovibrionota bacterium]